MSSWKRSYFLRLLTLGSHLGELDAASVRLNVSFHKQLTRACMGIQFLTVALPIAPPLSTRTPSVVLVDLLLPYLSSSTHPVLCGSYHPRRDRFASPVRH